MPHDVVAVRDGVGDADASGEFAHSPVGATSSKGRTGCRATRSVEPVEIAVSPPRLLCTEEGPFASLVDSSSSATSSPIV
jgi:hypothetical protein